MERIIEIQNKKMRVQYPDECPDCHHLSQIDIITASFLPDRQGANVIYRCGFTGCCRFFIGDYSIFMESLSLRSLSPNRQKVIEFPDNIKMLSNTFVTTYVEAERARHLGLSQIAGPGYRKAFEFLIKDYAKSTAPADQHSQIDHEFAGKVVEKFIAHPKIQSVAKRALWLGNDETHYLRKWLDKDIDDLITLIKLTVDWIEIDRLSSEYTDAMPD